MNRLRQWRAGKSLTQADAALLLGVSQTYLSLLETGARPITVTIQERMKRIRTSHPNPADDDRIRAQLSALGYPAFAHLKKSRSKLTPEALLLSVISRPDADARVVEALLWLVRSYAEGMDLNWLVNQAKLQNLQNRLGFLLQVAAPHTSEVDSALRQLEEARLLAEATLCWDSMPAATRDWLRDHRSPVACHWNILTRVQPEDIPNAA